MSTHLRPRLCFYKTPRLKFDFDTLTCGLHALEWLLESVKLENQFLRIQNLRSSMFSQVKKFPRPTLVLSLWICVSEKQHYQTSVVLVFNSGLQHLSRWASSSENSRNFPNLCFSTEKKNVFFSVSISKNSQKTNSNLIVFKASQWCPVD